MFSRGHHRNVADVLGALNASVLESASCFFGGGTAIALTRGEFRESDDIDFVVSDISGYRELRRMMSAAKGLGPITRSPLELAREVRGDQYGIRTVVSSSGVLMKFEIIHEGRIDLDPGRFGQRVCGILTLSTVDMAATKLLANDDRGADPSYHCRDLIDLAMLGASSTDLEAALSKVEKPYPSAVRSLNRTIDHALDRPGTLQNYMQALRMDPCLQTELRSRIAALRSLGR